MLPVESWHNDRYVHQGHSCRGMGATEVDVSEVETRRDVIASSIERMSDDETDEDDTVSGMDGWK
ncbi:hypothetical protein KI387_026467, partial [Taxus chinensis]